LKGLSEGACCAGIFLQ